MAQDETSLFNLALSAAANRARISHPLEQSREAEVCRLWYEPVRRQVLRAAAWTSARATARLAKRTEQVEPWIAGQPNPAFRFAYSLPENYLQARYLYDYARFDISLLSASETTLMTNAEEPIFYYIYDQKTIGLWDPDLYMAIAFALGAYITLPLSGKVSQSRAAQQQANAMIYSAREMTANEQFEPMEATPDWIAARGSAYSQLGPRYVYPYGPLISVPNV